MLFQEYPPIEYVRRVGIRGYGYRIAAALGCVYPAGPRAQVKVVLVHLSRFQVNDGEIPTLSVTYEQSPVQGLFMAIHVIVMGAVVIVGVHVLIVIIVVSVYLG